MPTDSTKQKAINAGKKLGLTRAHKMKNGKWMPGRTHAAYLNAKKKKRAGKKY